MSDHVAIVDSDNRGRFSLKKWMDRRPARWKIFVENDGKRIILEQVEES